MATNKQTQYSPQVYRFKDTHVKPADYLDEETITELIDDALVAAEGKVDWIPCVLYDNEAYDRKRARKDWKVRLGETDCVLIGLTDRSYYNPAKAWIRIDHSLTYEQMVVHLYHEIGHWLDPVIHKPGFSYKKLSNREKYDLEVDAWRIAYQLSKGTKYGEEVVKTGRERLSELKFNLGLSAQGNLFTSAAERIALERAVMHTPPSDYSIAESLLA